MKYSHARATVALGALATAVAAWAPAPARAGTLSSVTGAYAGPLGAINRAASGRLTYISYNSTIGTVVQVTPPSSPGASWMSNAISSFDLGNVGGAPNGGVASDSHSGFYFVSPAGLGGHGAVLHTAPAGGGASGYTTGYVWNFTGGNDGDGPTSPVVAAGGAVYGTTYQGGVNKFGLVYKLSESGSSLTPIWNFTDGTDGATPFAPLSSDGAGGFFGITASGGAHGAGTIYHLTPPAAGQTAWKLATLYSFAAAGGDCSSPYWALLVHGGTLYGACKNGGDHNYGTVFTLAPPKIAGGAWQFTRIWSYTLSGNDGALPAGSPVMLNGVLYVTTNWGGPTGFPGLGAVTAFKKIAGKWTAASTDFNGYNAGGNPSGPLVPDGAGNLIGLSSQYLNAQVYRYAP